jgi:uncharacterized membrane protein
MSIPMAKPYRLESIDWLRGFVMIVMALDHARDFLSPSAANPLTDPNISGLLYATRWITHLCAPTFVLLAGISVGLMGKRRSPSSLSRFLFSRGLWLIFLEATVISFALKFNFSNSPALMIFGVIWAIGASMIMLSGLIYLPRTATVIVGLAIVAGSNLLDGILPVGRLDGSSPLWLCIHRPIIWQLGAFRVLIGYPVLAWSGLMTCGYGLAPVFLWEAQRRQKFLFVLGGVLLTLFFLLRLSNAYGDPNNWTIGDTLGRTVMAFLNVTKYPPSLLFLSVTIGFAMLLLALAERWRPPLYDVYVLFGRVPLFYYIVHHYVIHILALLGGLIQGFPVSALLIDPFTNKPEGFGFGLPVIYLVWIGVVIGLYPPCRWFACLKSERNDWWLSYL